MVGYAFVADAVDGWVQPGQKVLIPQGSKFCLGVGWDVSQNSTTDLDASCVCFDAYGDVVDVVFIPLLRTCFRTADFCLVSECLTECLSE